MKTIHSRRCLKFVRLILVTLLLTSGFSCQKDEMVEKTADKELTTFNDLVSFGFHPSDIEEHSDHFVVEGDIRFYKNRDYNAHIDHEDGRVKQARTGLVSQTAIQNVTVRVDASIPTSGDDNWHDAISQAINDWNAIPDNIVHFVHISSGPADITISSDGGTLSNLTIAEASFPSSGAAGDVIRINLDFNGNQNVPYSQKRYNIVHELGHCIGLRHTNWSTRGESTATHINATPCSDPNSVMNGGTAANLYNGFSSFDQIAVQMIYPTPRALTLRPFLRYYSILKTNHLYTPNWNDIGCGNSDYAYQGFDGYIHTTQVAGTYPLYRYYSSSDTDHFYSTGYDPNPTNYVYEGVAGYVYTSPGTNRIPIYRFYINSGSNKNHFYSTSSTVPTNYVAEGIAWYAHQ